MIDRIPSSWCFEATPLSSHSYLIKEHQVRPPPHSAAKFREDGWYVVAGGTGGLGQEIIGWMAGLGAKNIIAVSRSGGKTEKFIRFSERMRKAGLNLLVESIDITDIVQVKRILDLTGGQPVSGIIQGAVMLNVSHQ